MTSLQKTAATIAGVAILGASAAAITSETQIEQLQQRTGNVGLSAEDAIDSEVQAWAQYEAAESNCHPSYSGCLKKNAGDYDCSGGSGNGPNYTGRVQVYGYDEFDLDRNGDGLGCEN